MIDKADLVSGVHDVSVRDSMIVRRFQFVSSFHFFVLVKCFKVFAYRPKVVILVCRLYSFKCCL